ncbi:MAG: chromosomal replication initiator protein DnaA [Prevotellaceae bacterium]|nr:chromosomal replication initiator protein DnaA [Prevotellaceae bacterium]
MKDSPKLLWDRCLDIIRDNISPEQFAASFAFVEFHCFEEGKLELNVPSEFIKELLEKNYPDLMRSTLKRVFGNSIKALYFNKTVVNVKTGGKVSEKTNIAPKPVNGPARDDARKTPDDVTAPQVQDLDSQLVPHYNFDNYIEGASNKLARSVGDAIAKNPAQKTFNPFFVYGPSGCGKTHLINAIGLRIKELYPQMRVLYLSAHLFTVQYTDAVRQNKVNDFIRFYQTIDTLILDDVQELSGKTQTQNTFFHIFNHLHINGKQIILSADRPPVAIQGIEDRLLTRFKWGMLAEIEKPTQAMRLDILMAKVDKEGLNIPEKVLKVISENIDYSVRDLEGIINSLMAYSVVYNCDVNMGLLQKIMPRFVEVNDKPITIEDVKERVCEHFNLKVSQIDSRTRTQKIAHARQMAMFLACELTGKSNVQVGLNIGNRNHATVIHAIKHIKDMIEIDEETRQTVDELRSTLRTARG